MEAAFTLNVGVALLLGLIIGLERQLHQHPAGLRTNALVCAGAAMFVSVSRLLETDGSVTRVAGQVVSGIGFLGGGVILREGLTVRGMTTAATLWCSAAIGTLSGLGYPVLALIGTTAILTTNIMVRPLSLWIDAHAKSLTSVDTNYRVRVVCNSSDEALMRTILMRHIDGEANMLVQGLSIQPTDQAGHSAVVADIHSNTRDDRKVQDVLSRLNIEPTVVSASWEKLR